MRVEKERRKRRIRGVEADLVKFGISAGTVRSLIHCYPVGLLEKLISATEKRQPKEPATYFLNGLKRARIKHTMQYNLIEDEDT